MSTTYKPTFDRAAAYAIPPVAARPDIACRGEDARIFYPDQGHKADLARTICARCPRRRECLDWAVDTAQAFGVWGGTTPEERHRLRKAREATP